MTTHLSPDEIALKRFHPVWRGFDEQEVRAFLERAAEDYREAVAEAEHWHEVADRLASRLGQQAR